MSKTEQIESAQRTARLLTSGNIGLSLLLCGMLAAVFYATQSQLAFAQGVDSLVDALTAVALLWALRLAAMPADSDHPSGHRAAEPIAALVVAVLAGVMGVEVIHSAVDALMAGEGPRLRPSTAAAFGTKVAAKAAVAIACWRVARQTGPVVRALFVDARNDIVAGLVALFGYVLVQMGWPAWDAWLAIPTGIWIITSGFGLARENLGLLMGAVASRERHAALQAIVDATEGVLSTHDLVAHHHGTHLDVQVHVVVDESLSLRDAHDIGDVVEAALRSEPDVVQVNVHLDVAEDD